LVDGGEVHRDDVPLTSIQRDAVINMLLAGCGRMVKPASLLSAMTVLMHPNLEVTLFSTHEAAHRRRATPGLADDRQ
jgi:hypothetical protein